MGLLGYARIGTQTLFGCARPQRRPNFVSSFLSLRTLAFLLSWPQALSTLALWNCCPCIRDCEFTLLSRALGQTDTSTNSSNLQIRRTSANSYQISCPGFRSSGLKEIKWRDKMRKGSKEAYSTSGRYYLHRLLMRCVRLIIRLRTFRNHSHQDGQFCSIPPFAAQAVRSSEHLLWPPGAVTSQ